MWRGARIIDRGRRRLIDQSIRGEFEAGGFGRLDRISPGLVGEVCRDGDDDGVNPIYSSEGKERWFTGPYQRKVMQGIGHFPQRESSHSVADEILKFCGLRG
jgi:pimeloyl-ACP methyl ester carboxylesterase